MRSRRVKPLGSLFLGLSKELSAQEASDRMHPEVPEAAQLQASRSQELRSALIRGGSMQLQPQLPPAKLLGQQTEDYLRPVDLPFRPNIRKLATPEARPWYIGPIGLRPRAGCRARIRSTCGSAWPGARTWMMS